MRIKWTAVAGVIALLTILVRPHHAATTTQPVTIEKELRVKIPMRDGVRLSTNIFRPSATGRWPVLLARTPYGKGSDITLNYRAFVEHGYAVVVQDVRGRHDSEGVFRPLDQEGPDGEDTLYWIAHQPWCDGKIGMMGGSYLGIAQWQAALRNSPYLKAIFPAMSGDDDYFDRFYSRGGAMKLGHRLLWIAENLHPYGIPEPAFDEYIRHLPLRTTDRYATGHSVEFYQSSLDHPLYDSHWQKYSTREKLEHIHVPVFAVGGWFDNYAESDLEACAALRKTGRPAYVLIGPWPHNLSDRLPGIDFGPDAWVPLRRLQFEWFDHWLKSEKTSIADLPAAHVFTMGANRWQDLTEWPPSGSQIVEYYLASKGKANSLAGDGVLQPKPKRQDQPDEFLYDPRNPVPTRGGAICCNQTILPAGPMDQRSIEKRQDVLVYTSGPLKKDLEVTGIVRVVLYASTSAPDTDFTAKLVDVLPDGTARGITDGILRLRYRRGLDHVELAHSGDVYEISIDAGVTSNVFLAGHRIRLEVSSSNFPRFDRNPNTGRAIADETELRMAHQTVHHGGLLSSALLLPVVNHKQ